MVANTAVHRGGALTLLAVVGPTTPDAGWPYARTIVDRSDDRRPALGSDGSFDRPGGLFDQLTRWLADQPADNAASARSRERWLRQQAQEDGTFAGVLLDLGERDVAVVVKTAGGRQHRGHVRAVAGDFAVLGTERSVDVLLAFAGIVSVRPEPDAVPTVGDRVVALDTLLGHVLVGLAGDRPRVFVVTLDGSGTAGELRAAGRDVLTLRLDGGDRQIIYLALAAVAEVSLTDH